VLFVLHDGVVSFVSSASVDVSGISPEELHGRNALDFVHPDDRERLLPYFAPGWQGVIDARVRVRQADGSWQWRHVEGVRTLDADGHGSAVFKLTR
jgi:PAS domain S-box-containing protein